MHQRAADKRLKEGGQEFLPHAGPIVEHIELKAVADMGQGDLDLLAPERETRTALRNDILNRPANQFAATGDDPVQSAP